MEIRIYNSLWQLVRIYDNIEAFSQWTPIWSCTVDDYHFKVNGKVVEYEDIQPF